MNNKTEIETSPNGTNEVETETKAAETETKVTETEIKATETETKSELSDKVEIKIKNYDGVIKLELDKNKAPITVDNFLSLVNNKFYDGLTFHRIIPGFMIQGGDPLGNGMGGSEKSIKGEFSSNGVNNDISHKRGVISMARSMDPNSASSQFFIVHQDSLFLDGNYAAFGYVTEGMDIVDKICEDIEPKIQDDNGTVLKEDQPVIEYIKTIK